jgi:hypothetical protein
MSSLKVFGELRAWLNSLCGDCDGQVVRHGETRTEVNKGWTEKEGVKERKTVKRREMEGTSVGCWAAQGQWWDC